MNYLVYFIIGGTMMALLKFTAVRSDSLAGILGALPIFSGTFLLLNIIGGEKNLSEIISQSRGSVFGMAIGAVFYITVCVALYFRLRSGEAFGIAAGVSLFAVAVSLYIRGTGY